MSTKSVIIALVVALCLGIGAYFVLRPQAQTESGSRFIARDELVCGVNPASVKTIEVETAEGEIDALSRGKDGGWTLTVTRQSKTDGHAWPLEEGRVGNLLRVLANVRALDVPDPKAALDDGATRVTIREDGGKVTHLLLAGRTLTGRGLVEVIEGTASNAGADLVRLSHEKGKLAMVSDVIHNVFRQPGPTAWRDTTAMPGVGPDVSRIAMVNNDLKMKLGRVEGKWGLQEPVAAPADPDQVAKLIGILQGLKITAFSVPADAKTGLDAPMATIETETDRRVISDDASKPGGVGGVSVKAETHGLRVGLPADAQPPTRYASMGEGGPVVVISQDGLARELFDPVQYVTRHAAQTPTPDIGMLIFERTVADTAAEAAKPPEGQAAKPGESGAAPTAAPPATPAAAEPLGRVFQRELETWKEVTGTSAVSLDPTMLKGVKDAIAFLTGEKAESVSFQPPAVWKEQGNVIIGSLAGTPLETLTVVTTDGGHLGIRSGGTGADAKGAVFRWYPRERAPELISSMLPKPTEPVKAPAAGKEPEVMK